MTNETKSIYTLILVLFILNCAYTCFSTVFSLGLIDGDRTRMTKIENQIATFQNIHICEDRTHQTCDGDCDCDGLNCDTL